MSAAAEQEFPEHPYVHAEDEYGLTGCAKCPHPKHHAVHTHPTPSPSRKDEENTAVVLPAPYYEGGGVVLYHGDWEDVLPSLPKADLIFTSPPYNLGVSTGGGLARKPTGGHDKWKAPLLANGYADHDDAMTPADYDAWQRRFLGAAWERLSDTGAIFYNHKPRVQGQALWTPLDVNPGLPVRQIITWARAGGINFAPTHYVPTYEWIVVFARPRWRLTSKGASGVGDLWRIPQESGTPHPAPFPVALPARAIETAGPGLVIDPYAGSGSTLLAAKRAGVRAIGIEKAEAYCEIAAERLGGPIRDTGDGTLFGAAS